MRAEACDSGFSKRVCKAIYEWRLRSDYDQISVEI